MMTKEFDAPSMTLIARTTFPQPSLVMSLKEEAATMYETLTLISSNNRSAPPYLIWTFKSLVTNCVDAAAATISPVAAAVSSEIAGRWSAAEQIRRFSPHVFLMEASSSLNLRVSSKIPRVSLSLAFKQLNLGSP